MSTVELTAETLAPNVNWCCSSSRTPAVAVTRSSGV